MNLTQNNENKTIIEMPEQRNCEVYDDRKTFIDELKKFDTYISTMSDLINEEIQSNNKSLFNINNEIRALNYLFSKMRRMFDFCLLNIDVTNEDIK